MLSIIVGIIAYGLWPFIRQSILHLDLPSKDVDTILQTFFVTTVMFLTEISYTPVEWWVFNFSMRFAVLFLMDYWLSDRL